MYFWASRVRPMARSVSINSSYSRAVLALPSRASITQALSPCPRQAVAISIAEPLPALGFAAVSAGAGVTAVATGSEIGAAAARGVFVAFAALALLDLSARYMRRTI